MTTPRDEVIVGESYVKGVELWFKTSGAKSFPLERMVVAPEVLLPVRIPRTCGVGSWVAGRRAFPDPEDRSSNLVAPRVVPDLPWRRGFVDDLGDARPQIGVFPARERHSAIREKLLMSLGCSFARCQDVS